MCGFAGELARGRRQDVERMALAHRRLKIIDLSRAGDQPTVDDAAAIVLHGCIYNHRELRAELELWL